MSEETTQDQQPKKVVIVEMEGGVIQNVTCNSSDVEVIVLDTDLEDVSDEYVVSFMFRDKETVGSLTSYRFEGGGNEDWEAAVVGAMRKRLENEPA